MCACSAVVSILLQLERLNSLYLHACSKFIFTNDFSILRIKHPILGAVPPDPCFKDPPLYIDPLQKTSAHPWKSIGKTTIKLCNTP